MKSTIQLLFMLVFFASCENSRHQAASSIMIPADSLYQTYLAQGKQVVSLSFAALSQRLQKAIVAHGTDSALSFCSVHALPITDSLSQTMLVEISRTALRYRNPENAPEPLDEQVMNHFKQMKLQIGMLPDTLVVNESGGYVYMAPIVTLPACLQCHGIPEIEIKPQTLGLIQSLYPDDRAIGFREGELRGMWKVRFANNTK